MTEDITPAEAHGWTVMDLLPAEQRDALWAAIGKPSDEE